MTGLPCAEADWPRFSALLEAGLDVPVGGQAAWLAALGEEDGRLKPALARVLGQAGARDTAEFLRLPRLDDTGFSPGERIGAYVLVPRFWGPPFCGVSPGNAMFWRHSRIRALRSSTKPERVMRVIPI
jgi:hypothetical protein